MKKRNQNQCELQIMNAKVGDDMAKFNNKAVRSISKLVQAGIDSEKSVLSLTLDDILALPGITVAEIEMINEVQKAVKANKVITLLSGGEI